MRLRSRLLLLTLLPPLLSLLVFGGVLLWVFDQQQQQLLLQQRTLLLNTYAEQLAASNSPLERSHLLQKLMQHTGVKGAALYHLDNQPLNADNILLDSADGNYQQKSIRLPLNSTPPLQLKVLFDDHQSVTLHYRLWLLLLCLSLVLLLVSGLLALRFTFTISDPLDRILAAIRRYRDGHFERPPESGASAELQQLDAELVAMAHAIKTKIDELEESSDLINEDMRLTMEALEVQNIELDIARKDIIQASEMKNEFFNSMNHEIRTALNSILGFSRLLGRTPLDEAQLMHLAGMQKGANNLLNIVNNILDHSRLEEKKMRITSETFSLRALIEELQEAMSPLAHERNIEQITLIDSQLPARYLGDMPRLRQILANLISNAIKFSRNSNVVVRALLESRHYENITLKIAVSDSGPGLTDEQRIALFQPYNQGRTNPSGLTGSGLGLSICKRLADEMGAQIRVESEPGKGSTFTVLVRLEADIQNLLDNDIGTSLRGQSVWLLEAHEQLRIVLHQQLGGCAAQVHELPNNPELHEQLPFYEKGDIYIVDVDHPGDVNLDALLAQLLKQGMPCLLLAHYPEVFRLRLSPWPDFFQLLGKPATQKRLRDELLQLGGSTLERLPAMNVMVVDDHEGNLRLAQLVLQDMGMHTSGHDNAQSALEAFSKQRPDLVLMDIYMPEMDGRECTRRMRQMEMEGEHTPIHALTAELQKMEPYRLQEIGLDGCLTKPLDEQALFSLLVSLSMRKRPADDKNDLPLFDEALALKRCGGRTQVARELQQMLLRDLNDNAAKIRELAQAAEWQALLEVVHKLHGGTRYCGVPRLERAANRLEAALKQESENERLTRLVRQLLEQMDQLQQAEAINDFISRTA